MASLPPRHRYSRLPRTLLWDRLSIATVASLLACAAGPSRETPLLQRHDIRSASELLTSLPESVRARHVLMFETRSPQGATYEAPRVIFFAEGAREVFAFGPANDSVDIMTFDEGSASFDPRYRSVPVRVETTRDKAERTYHGAPLAGPAARNAELGELFGSLNARSIARQLAAAPSFEREKYPLMAALVPSCTDAHPDGAFAPFAAATTQTNDEQASSKARRAHATLPMRARSDERPLTWLRFLAETRLGVRASSWTLALEKGTYDFATWAPRRACRSRRAASGPWNGADPAPLCAELARRMSPKSSARPLARTNALRELPVLDRCASCHERDVGPRIPFTQPKALRDLLRATPSLFERIRFRLQPESGVKRMPQGASLTADEERALLGYLEELKAHAGRGSDGTD